MDEITLLPHTSIMGHNFLWDKKPLKTLNPFLIYNPDYPKIKYSIMKLGN